MMNKLAWPIIAVATLILVVFIVLNRNHAKIQEAIIVAVAGLLTVVLGVVFLWADNNELHKQISVVSFVSLKDRRPVFFTSPVLVHYLLNQGIVWGDFERQNSDLANKLFEGLPNNTEGLKNLADLQAIALMQHLLQAYMFSWDMEHTKKVFPGAVSVRGKALNRNPKDKKVFENAILLDIFEKNIFHKSLSKYSKLTLPKGTNIKYIPYDDKMKKCQIIFSKRFAFKVKFTLSRNMYMAGLGNVGSYVGLTKPTNVWGVNWKERDDFGTAIVNIQCDAEFFPWLSGNPNIQTYKEWIGNLFVDLYNSFDWEVCNEAMKEYNAELAHQVTLNNLGKKLEQPESNEDKTKK